MKTVLLVFGTRPEAIKMAPLVKEFQKYPDRFKTVVCVTGQHREMLDQVLQIFEIRPDYDLNIMKQGQDLYDVTSRVLLGIYGTEMNPIVVNEASPVSFVYVSLSGDMGADLSLLAREAERSHAGYLYLKGASDDLTDALSERINEPFELRRLYELAETKGLLS